MKRRNVISPQSRSGGGEGIQTVGYAGSQPVAALVVAVRTGAGEPPDNRVNPITGCNSIPFGATPGLPMQEVKEADSGERRRSGQVRELRGGGLTKR